MQFASEITKKTATDHRIEDGRELFEWAEPIIADRVREFYTVTVPLREAQSLALHHRQLWRSLLLDKLAQVDRSRRELRRLGGDLGLRADFADSLDNGVIEELLDIVLIRYRASRDTARRFSRILMAAAAELGAARNDPTTAPKI